MVVGTVREQVQSTAAQAAKVGAQNLPAPGECSRITRAGSSPPERAMCPAGLCQKAACYEVVR